MAIAFSCTCGKQLRARDEFAGRKIRCPGCQSVITIPKPAPVAVSVPTLEPEAKPQMEEEHPAEVPLARPVAMKVPGTLIPPAPAPADSPSPVATAAVSVKPLPNPWADHSLEQTATPWLGDDRERFNHGMEERRGSRVWLVLAALFVVVALTAALLIA